MLHADRRRMSIGGPSEVAWLIELAGNHGAPNYFQLEHDNDWTSDANRALRFARRQDAQAYIYHIGWTEPKPVEHMWLGPKDQAALLPRQTYQVSRCDDGEWMVHTDGDVIAYPGQGNEEQKARAICAALNCRIPTVGEWESSVQLWRLRNTVRDAIESLERNSTSAPVVECLKASLTPAAATKTIDEIIEACAKIAQPWAGFWLDKNSSEADRDVVEVRTEIAAKIRALAIPSQDRA